MKAWVSHNEDSKSRTPWIIGKRAACCGWIDRAGKILSGEELLLFIESRPTLPLEEIDGGEFAIILESSEGFEAMVDAVSSIPIFYRASPKLCFASSAVDLELKRSTIDERLQFDSLASFLISGMALGERTLIASVKRIQAGGVRRFSREGEGISQVTFSDTSEDYILATNQLSDSERDYDHTILQARNLLEKVVERSLSSIGSNPVWIPLSGGLDSRLLVYLYREAGVVDLNCFSYGRMDSFESKRSEMVAASLNLPWCFVPYSAKKWQAWFLSDEYQDYRRWAFLHSAIEHEQDWPAVKQLGLEGRLDPNSVFVPGHAMDFLAGSHLPKKQISDGLGDVVGKYFNLWPHQEMHSSLEIALTSDTHRYVRESGLEGRALFESFGWKERQSKMITNSVRVYEHHSFSWRLPFWDPELTKFWMSLPYEWRVEKKLYLDLCRQILPSDLFEIPYEPPHTGKLENTWTRLTDRNYSRQGMFSKGIVKSIPIQSIESEIQDLPSEIQRWFEPIKKRPLVSIPFNGQLSLRQIVDLFN